MRKYLQKNGQAYFLQREVVLLTTSQWPLGLIVFQGLIFLPNKMGINFYFMDSNDYHITPTIGLVGSARL